MLASALEGNGVGEGWETICEFRAKMAEGGGLREKRRRQGKYWTEKFLRDMVARKLEEDEGIKERKGRIDRALEDGTITPRMAAEKLMDQVF